MVLNFKNSNASYRIAMAVVLLSLVAISTATAAPPTRCNPERLPTADGVARPPPPTGKAKLQLLAQVQGEEKTWPASKCVHVQCEYTYKCVLSASRRAVSSACYFDDASHRVLFFYKGLDGSPYGFFHYESSASNRWTIYLQGGGWCYDEIDCLCRSKSSMGSSTKLPPTWVAQTDCLNPLTDGTVRVHNVYQHASSNTCAQLVSTRVQQQRLLSRLEECPT